jgi:type I restriction enzyme S subunit
VSDQLNSAGSSLAWDETEFGDLPSCWQVQTVGRLVECGILSKPLDGNHGEIHPKGNDFVADGIPFVMATDIKDGKIDLVGCKFISKTQADSLSKGFAISGDVLLTHKATLGRVAIVGTISTPYIMLTPQVTYYRVLDEKRLSNRYLRYFFEAPVFQDILRNHGDSGSTRAYVGITAQRDLPVVLPATLDEQNAIADVLASLDSKIDLLHRQNRTLEAMSQAMFRQWFEEQADSGWEEYSVGQFAAHIKISIKPEGSPEQLYAHYSLPAFDAGREPAKELGSEILSNKFKVEPWVILVSKLNPRVPRIWPVGALTTDHTAVCSTEFQVLKPNGKDLFAYLYCLLSSRDAKDALTMAASGTSGSHQRVRPEDILNIKTMLPSVSLAEEFSSMVQPLIDKQFANTQQAHKLASLRDTLLPKIMSGEIRVAC